MKHLTLPEAFEEEPCSNCGRILIANQPFIDKDFCGYQSEECPCGEGDQLSMAFMRDEAKGIEFYNQFSESLESTKKE